MKYRILLVSEIPPVPAEKYGSGGLMSTYMLLNYLRNYFDIHILTNMSVYDTSSFNLKEFKLHNVKVQKIPKVGFINNLIEINRFRNELSILLESIRPDIIMSNTHLISSCVDVASRHNIKSVVWIRSYENFYLSEELKYMKSKYKKIDFIIKKVLFRNKDYRAIRKASFVLVNSIYMKNVVDKEFGVHSEVVYPPISCDSYLTIKPSDVKVVGFLKPEVKKGIDIVIEIARRMPNIEFLCYGEKPVNYEKISSELNNLHFVGWINDHKKIFSSIRILIVPSIWEEPFGRVVIEALASGVLPIVSNRGGLPEAVGDKLLIVGDNWNIDAWVKKIQLYLENGDAFEKAIRVGKEHIKKFSIENQGKNMKIYLENVCS